MRENSTQFYMLVVAICQWKSLSVPVSASAIFARYCGRIKRAHLRYFELFWSRAELLNWRKPEKKKDDNEPQKNKDG